MILPIGFEFFITFIFVFGVVYGLLVVADIFGKNQKRVNAIIALAFGLFAASYEPVVVLIQTLLPYATGVLIVVFILVFLKLLIFGKSKKDGKKERDPVIVAVMLTAVIIFVAAAGSSGLLEQYIPRLPYMEMTNILWITGLLLILVIFYMAYTAVEKKS